MIPRGMIKLPMQVGNEVVEVDFIVVETYSPLHSYFSEALASCHGSGVIYATYEGQISYQGVCWGAC